MKTFLVYTSLGITGVIALGCCLIVPLWIFGVPGIENEYARGWMMSFMLILLYPLFWAINLCAFIIMAQGNEKRSVVALLPALALIPFACFMFMAFRMMGF